MSDRNLTAEAALAAVKEAAAGAKVRFAQDNLAAAYDDEIQEIFSALRVAITGKEPAGPVWASDESMISDTLDLGPNGQMQRSLKALHQVAVKLGIPLAKGDYYYEAAMRLRALRLGQKGS